MAFLWDAGARGHVASSLRAPLVNREDRPTAHSYISSLYHVVFSTKDHRKQVDADLQPRL